MRLKNVWICIICCCSICSFSQSVTMSDYERAVSFMYDNYNEKTVFNLNPSVNWFSDGNGLYYHEFSAHGKVFKSVEFKDNVVRELFDHDKMAKALSIVHDEKIEPQSIGIYNIEKENTDKLRFESKGKTYTVDLESYDIKVVKNDTVAVENRTERSSPNGDWVAFAKDYNLYIRSTETGEEFQITVDGIKDNEYTNLYGWFDKMEGENGERQTNFFVSWSPNSKYLHTYQYDTRNAEKMYLLDWSQDDLFRPELLSYYRGSPGDTTMVMLRPVVIDVLAKKEIKLDLPTNTHINPVSISWSDREGEAYATYAERGYQKQFIKHVNLSKATVKTLVSETSETNIDNFTYRALDSLNKIIFLSERSGWRQYMCMI